jgi:hypothetical protein
MRRGMLVGLGLVVALGAAGCTVPSPAPSDVTPAPSAVASTPEETCAELSDVGTLVWNMQMAESEGRLVGNEFSGAMRLAARMLARVPVAPDTDLAGVVAALQLAAPTGVDPTGEEWVQAWAQVQDTCNEATGSPDVLDGFGIEGWVGG